MATIKSKSCTKYELGFSITHGYFILTNTNQQHYSGQAQLSYLSQMTGIVGLQVITPMMGLALVVATLRAFISAQAILQPMLPSSQTKF